VAEFEANFAACVAADHAIALNSCTAALHLALIACGIGAGDEVLVPTLTFAATAEVVLAVGATPVMVDCNADNLTIDADHAQSLLTERTRAIMPMHYGGTAADMSAILELKRTHPNLRIIEDAAHAFPTRHALGPIGSIGDATCFSFYANKTMTTGEGGMLTTNDPGIAEHVRRLSLHGLSRDAWARFETRSAWDYDIVEPGWKYNMTDLAGALGVVQLDRSAKLAAERRSIAAAYDEAFADVDGIRPRMSGDAAACSHHLYVVRVDPETCGASRDDVIRHLGSLDIGTSVHYRPLHMHSYYAKTMGFEPSDLPVAEDQFSRIVSLPIFPGMTDSETERVVSAVQEAIA
jgi:perosamine synthetase